MDNILFIITRNIKHKQQNNHYLHCYKNIRKFYPKNLIVFIDNNSKQSEVIHFPTTNCLIIQSELPEGRLFTPYYYYLTYFSHYKKAVILHDGIMIQRYIDFDSVKTAKTLWYFNTHDYDNHEAARLILSNLTNSKTLETEYFKQNWQGCFGCMMVISSSFLQLLQDKYNILKLSTIINNYDTACEMERIFGLLLYVELGYVRESMFGEIFQYQEWGLTFEKYEQQIQNYSHLPIVKLFGSRLPNS
jgi:hypothetical protein